MELLLTKKCCPVAGVNRGNLWNGICMYHQLHHIVPLASALESSHPILTLYLCLGESACCVHSTYVSITVEWLLKMF